MYFLTLCVLAIIITGNFHFSGLNMELGLSEKVLRYEGFVNDVLKEDLKKVHMRHEELHSEISEYIQLKNFIQSISDVGLSSDGLKTKMNLGCNFYIQANVSNISTILVAVGLGHYLEFTMEEALRFIEKRINLLTLQTEKLKKDSAKTKAMIKLVLGGLHQLQSSRSSKVK
jgi:prefoldin alpha subunit